MAEIAARLPEQFGEYIPVAAHLIVEFVEEDLEHFRPGCLWALGRLGPLVGDYIPDVLPPVETALRVRLEVA
jgi:hypothetical protein